MAGYRYGCLTLLAVSVAIARGVKAPSDNNAYPSPAVFVYNGAARNICNASSNARPVHMFSVTADNSSTLIALGMSECLIHDDLGDWSLRPDCSSPPQPLVARSTDGGTSWNCTEIPTMPPSVFRTYASTVASTLEFRIGGAHPTMLCIGGGEYMDPDLHAAHMARVAANGSSFAATDSIICSFDLGSTWTEQLRMPGMVRRGTMARLSGIAVGMYGGERKDGGDTFWWGIVDPESQKFIRWYEDPTPPGFGHRLYPIVHSQITGDTGFSQRIFIGGGLRANSSNVTADAGKSLSSLPNPAGVVALSDLFICDPCDFLADPSYWARSLAPLPSELGEENAVSSAAIMVGWGGASIANTSFSHYCYNASDPVYKCLVLFRGQRTYWSDSKSRISIEWKPLDVVLASVPANSSQPPRTPPPLVATAPAILRPTQAQDTTGLDFVAALSPVQPLVLGFSPQTCQATCEVGHYSTGCDSSPRDYTCEKCSQCSPGVTYASQPCFQASSATGPYGGDTVCSACTRCGTGKVQLSPCTLAADAVCVDVAYASQMCAASAAGMNVLAPVVGALLSIAVGAASCLVCIRLLPSSSKAPSHTTAFQLPKSDWAGPRLMPRAAQFPGVVSAVAASWPVVSSSVWFVASVWHAVLILVVASTCLSELAALVGVLKILVLFIAMVRASLARTASSDWPVGPSHHLRSLPASRATSSGISGALSSLFALMHPRAARMLSRHQLGSIVRPTARAPLMDVVLFEAPCLVLDLLTAAWWGGLSDAASRWSSEARGVGLHNWLLVCFVFAVLLDAVLVFISAAEMATLSAESAAHQVDTKMAATIAVKPTAPRFACYPIDASSVSAVDQQASIQIHNVLNIARSTASSPVARRLVAANQQASSFASAAVDPSTSASISAGRAPESHLPSIIDDRDAVSAANTYALTYATSLSHVDINNFGTSTGSSMLRVSAAAAPATPAAAAAPVLPHSSLIASSALLPSEYAAAQDAIAHSRAARAVQLLSSPPSVAAASVSSLSFAPLPRGIGGQPLPASVAAGDGSGGGEEADDVQADPASQLAERLARLRAATARMAAQNRIAEAESSSRSSDAGSSVSRPRGVLYQSAGDADSAIYANSSSSSREPSEGGGVDHHNPVDHDVA